MAKRFATNGLTGISGCGGFEIHGITNVQITSIPGKLTDHFNPKTNTIGLSESAYRGTSVADIESPAMRRVTPRSMLISYCR